MSSTARTGSSTTTLDDSVDPPTDATTGTGAESLTAPLPATPTPAAHAGRTAGSTAGGGAGSGAGIPDARERVSRKDAAILGRCCEDTITRDIVKHQLITTIGPGGCVMVALADLIRIGRVKAADLEVAGQGGHSAEVRRAQADSARLATENGRLAGAAEAHEMHLEVLRSQLKEKDKQIAELHKTIERTQAFARTAAGTSA